jgi:hypothetical protein
VHGGDRARPGRAGKKEVGMINVWVRWVVLGNLVKSCHPRNVGLSKFIKQVREAALRERYRFMKKGEGESPVEFRMFR